MEARAFAPGHISSFFAPHADPHDPPERRGSRGAGFCIEAGVTTAAVTSGARTSRAPTAGGLPFGLEVLDNGRPVEQPLTTRGALLELVRRAGRNARLPAALRLENRYTLPLGAGFGVSGACALTATIAANEAMALGLDRSDCVAAAHCGEVEALTGLGDVGPQSLGGFEIRVAAGAPPYGEVRLFEAPMVDVILVSFGPRPTRAFLSDPRGLDRLQATGERCLARLLEAPSLEACVRLGRGFAETLGLVSPQAGELMARLDPTAPCSVAMLGDSVFALGGREAAALARPLARGTFVETTRLTGDGATLL